MQITERATGSVTVVDLSGRLFGGSPLKDKVNSLLHQGKKQIVLNLAGVSYIDSAGLGDLVSAYATTMRNGGLLKLANVTRKNADLLSITRLVTVFETHDTEAAAVASFGAAKGR